MVATWYGYETIKLFRATIPVPPRFCRVATWHRSGGLDAWPSVAHHRRMANRTAHIRIATPDESIVAALDAFRERLSRSTGVELSRAQAATAALRAWAGANSEDLSTMHVTELGRRP